MIDLLRTTPDHRPPSMSSLRRRFTDIHEPLRNLLPFIDHTRLISLIRLTRKIGIGDLDVHHHRRHRSRRLLGLPHNLLPRDLPQVLPEPPNQPHPRRSNGIPRKLTDPPVRRHRPPEHQRRTTLALTPALNTPYPQGERDLHGPPATHLDGVTLHHVRVVLPRVRDSDPQGPAIRDRVPPDTHLQPPRDPGDARLAARVLLESRDRPGDARGVGEHVPQPLGRNRNEHLMLHDSRGYPARPDPHPRIRGFPRDPHPRGPTPRTRHHRRATVTPRSVPGMHQRRSPQPHHPHPRRSPSIRLQPRLGERPQPRPATLTAHP